MADSYSKWVMTNSFVNNLQASINSGNKIEWVCIKTSDDTHLFADLAGFNDTTLATASIKQTATINTISINGNTVTITALFNNQDNQADYYIKTLFLVAKYNGTEFLAGATVANSASTAFRMPAASATEITEFTARPQITVSNSSTISATVDPVAAATNKRVDGLEATLQGEIDDINADKQSLWNTLVNYVTKAGTDTITGVKTFTQTIVGSITGNAGTATKLATTRSVQTNLASTSATSFDGTADIIPGVTGVLGFGNGGNGRTDGVVGAGVSAIEIVDFNSIQLPNSNSQLVRGFPFSAGNGALNKPEASETGYRGWFLTFDASNSIQFFALGNGGTLYVGNGTTTVSTGRLVTVTGITWRKLSDNSTVVHNTGAETIAGTKTFTSEPFIKGLQISNGNNSTSLFKTNATIPNQINGNMPVGLASGSTLAVGGGEAAASYLAAMAAGAVPIGGADGAFEQLILVGDGAVYLGAGYQNGGTTGKWWTFASNGEVVSPDGGRMLTEKTGNAISATKLATARTIAVTGDVTGSGTFDGSGNLSITTTESATARTNTTSTQAGGYGSTVTIIDGVTTNSAGEVTGVNTKTLTLPSAQTTVTGNAGTATKLQTARTINGVVFDGTANISVNAANDASLVHKTGNETVAGVKTFSDWPVVTGLNVSNGTNTSGIVRINASIPNQSDNNVPIGLNTGSTLVLGGGEAANSYLAAMAAGAVPIGSASANNEQLVMAGDAAVYIGAGYQDGGTTGKWWAFNQDGTITSPNGNLMQEVTSTTINLYGKGTYFVNDTATDGDYLRLIVSGKVVSVQGTLMTKVAMSGGAYLGEAIVPAQYAPPVARKNTVGFNAGSPGSKVYADVAWSIDGMLSIDNIVNGSNMTAWGTIPAGSQLSFADTWVIA